MSKKKPNYTQYMKRPAPLQLSPPSDDDHRPAPMPSAPKKDRVLEEDLPWGEVIVEFAPNDSVPLQATPVREPLQTGPGLSPQQEIPAPKELSIPFGSIVTDDQKRRPTPPEPVSDPGRQEVRRTGFPASPAQEPVISGTNMPRADSAATALQEVESRAEALLQEQWGGVERAAGPPLGVMAMAVAVVVILFLLVQSS